MKKQNQQNFLLSVLVILVFPLVPIVMELVIKKSCLDTTLALTTALYSVTVLTTSKNPVYFFASFFPSMIFSGIYVNLLNKEAFLSLTPHISQNHSLDIILETTFSLIAIGIIHGAERYNRHIKESEPFFQFYK